MPWKKNKNTSTLIVTVPQKEDEPKCIKQLRRTLMSLAGGIHSRLISQQRKSKRKKGNKKCTGIR